ncbi:lysophosphatidylcholine acyltransferase-like [Artemia franciscana]|uniref:lysophosphatidylcholine acyltransferase-like n=1 Tax=Artemia franciscana TaxID=6661 RepID=UPI0032DA422E
MFIFKTIVIGIPVSVAGISACWAIKKYMEYKTTECSTEGAEVQSSEPNKESEPNPAAVEIEKNKDHSYTRKEEHEEEKCWKNLDPVCKSAASICKSVKSFLKTAASCSITVNESQCDVHQAKLQTNPFRHRINLSIYDKVKMFISSIVLFPLRVIGVATCLVTSYSIASIGLLGVSEEELKSKPMQGWRRTLQAIVSKIMVGLFYCSGFRVRVKGRQAMTREAPILVLAPHSSVYDALLVFFLGSPSIVAKEEVKKLPFIGKLVNFTQPIYVDREDPNSRSKTIEEMVRRATSEDPWQQTLIFPEGTCSNGKSLITFKPGAFYPGVAVQPVCIRYPNRLDTVTWTWDGPEAWKTVFYTMTQLVTYAEIEFLPPYVPSDEEKRKPKMFASNVRSEMAKCLEVPIVDYSFEDCQLMNKATKLELPSESGLIGVANLRSKYGFDRKDLETDLECFAKIADKKDGVIRLQDLASYLKIRGNNPCLMQIFKAYDQDSKGFITFKEFIVGKRSASLLCHRTTEIGSCLSASGAWKERLCTFIGQNIAGLST